MYCSNCGAKNNKSDKFCSNCGAKLVKNEINIDNNSNNNSNLENKEKSLKYIRRNFRILFVIGIICLLLGIGSYNSGNAKPSGGNFWISSVAEQKKEEKDIGTVLILIGSGLIVFSFVYKNNAKAKI